MGKSEMRHWFFFSLNEEPTEQPTACKDIRAPKIVELKNTKRIPSSKSHEQDLRWVKEHALRVQNINIKYILQSKRR